MLAILEKGAKNEYAVFSDESCHTAARFRSIAAVSMHAGSVASASSRIASILEESGVQEFKWHDLKGARERFCAIKLLNFLLDELLCAGARVDVLIWDTYDSRHQVLQRDDRKNYERMFFHLHKTLMRRREPQACWHLHPDERLDIDWETVKSCLQSVGAWRRYFEHPLLREEFSEALFEVRTLQEVGSRETPLCQLADLFAGLAPYTRANSQVVTSWFNQQSGQQLLLGEIPDVQLSRSDKERLPVLSYLYHQCRQRRLGVSLMSVGYLRTLDPTRPVNFWHYEPQHHLDRAPALDG